MQTELTILSYGAGQDSTALLYMLAFDEAFRAEQAPGRLLVVMADTGDEHPATVKHVAHTVEFCKEHGIEFVHITPDMGFHTGDWAGGLRGFYKAGNRIGSKAYPKTCTDKLKVQPIYKFVDSWVAEQYGIPGTRKAPMKRFVEKHGKIRVLIGIAGGEEKRVAGATTGIVWMDQCIDRVYPLVDLAMDRKACQEYIASVGQEVPPPSNCILCPFMSEIELLWLYRSMPDSYQDWVEMEANKLKANEHLGERNLGVWGRKTLPQKLEDAEAKHGHMTMDELNEYKMSHGHCVASKY